MVKTTTRLDLRASVNTARRHAATAPVTVRRMSPGELAARRAVQRSRATAVARAELPTDAYLGR